jgi:uncharacterized damage-inducible protein DinB
MYHTIEEFMDSWDSVSTSTAKMLNALTDESLGQAVSDGHRTLGRIAWHIVCTIPEMCDKMGLDFADVDIEAPTPTSAKEICDAYVLMAATVGKAIKLDWNDDVLTTEVDMYGQKWKRNSGLQALIEHEIHHRGQMTVLMRQAGIRVPSLYGPAKEDWAGMDMEPPPV